MFSFMFYNQAQIFLLFFLLGLMEDTLLITSPNCYADQEFKFFSNMCNVKCILFFQVFFLINYQCYLLDCNPLIKRLDKKKEQ